MHKKGKLEVIFGLIPVFSLIAFTIVLPPTPICKANKHPPGIETESCQDAVAGAEECIMWQNAVEGEKAVCLSSP